MTNKEKKTKVRATKEWQEFRKEMYERSGGIDRITGKPLRKGWQLHHLDLNPDNYAILDSDKFVCVNRTTHEMIHWLFRYRSNWKQCMCNLADVIGEMCYFND